MKLLEIRRLTIKKRMRIHFTLPNGMEGYVNENGIAKIPALKTVPDFNMEESLTGVTAFRVETLLAEGKTKSQTANEADLRKMLATVTPGAAAATADHDE